MMSDTLDVRTAHTIQVDPVAAAGELARDLRQEIPALVLLFASSRLDVNALVPLLDDQLPDHDVIGCTTSGEISPAGFHERSAVAMSLGGVRWHAERITPLSRFTHAMGSQAVARACAGLGVAPDRSGDSVVGLVFIDGLQAAEEMLMASLGIAAPSLPIVGASASDDFAFEHTHVFFGGAAHEDSAMFLMLRVPGPMHLLKQQHFRRTDRKVVVTGALPHRRRVTELDGKPAAQVYARLLGEPLGALSRHARFLLPFSVTIRGEPFIRSVMRVEPGEGLHFACAVEEGVVLTLMRPGDLVASTREGIAAARRAVGGTMAAMLAFNCLGRLFEARDSGRADELAEAFHGCPVAGFHTYGEQYASLHVNHTLTGLVLGPGASG
jgi:hypothetical protein